MKFFRKSKESPSFYLITLLFFCFIGLIVATSTGCPMPSGGNGGGDNGDDDDDDDADEADYSEFLVGKGDTNTHMNPALAMDADGNFVVAWDRGNTFSISARLYDSSGTAKGARFTVNTYTSNHQKDPDVAMNSSGDFVVVWESWYQDNQKLEVYGRVYKANGQAKGDPFRVNQYRASYQRDATVAIDDSGKFVVAYSSFRDGANRVYVRRFGAGGNPIGNEFPVSLIFINQQESHPQEQFEDSLTQEETNSIGIAMDGAGNFVVVWSGVTNNGISVLARLYNAAGTALGDAIHIKRQIQQEVKEVAVSMAQDGRFVVAWSPRFQNDNEQVFARRLNASGKLLGDEIKVTAANSLYFHPSVAMANDGQFIVAYTALKPGEEEVDIEARKYNAAGEAQGGSFKVNEFTEWQQSGVSIAINQTIYALAWHTDGFGQYFSVACRIYNR